MKNKGKPRFGIMVAITESPVGKAYKKAEKMHEKTESAKERMKEYGTKKKGKKK